MFLSKNQLILTAPLLLVLTLAPPLGGGRGVIKCYENDEVL